MNFISKRFVSSNFRKRLSVSFLIFFSCIIPLSAIAQNKISVKRNGTSILSIMKEIEKQSGYTLFYNNDLVNLDTVTSLDVSDAPLKEVLALILSKTPYTYEIVNNQIVISQQSLPTKDTESARKLTGTVKDKSGEPIIGATVVVLGSSKGAITDINGQFFVEITNQTKLKVSYIGYQTKELTFKAGADRLRIVLQEDSKLLQEIVVVGYGTQKKVNLTGAISSVDSESLTNRPLTSSSQALQGVQGLYVSQLGGQPGPDKTTIMVRGMGTLNSNAPLVLIDGIEGNLNDLNPNDIESISVLKDAASSAVYGSRAANGVILVKSKTGKAGDKFTINYNNYYGSQSVTYLPDAVWDSPTYLKYRDIAEVNAGKIPIYGEKLINEYAAGMKTDPYKFPSTNWFDLVFRNAFIQEHNIRVSGGGNKYTFSASLGYLDQEGVMIGTQSDKYSANFNTTIEISKRLNVGVSMIASYRKYDEPHMGADNFMGSIFRSLPVQLAMTEDGKYGRAEVQTPGQGTFMNLLGHPKEGRNNHKQQRIIGKVFAEYTFPFNIKYKIDFGANKFDEINKIFTPIVVTYMPISMVPQNSTGERRSSAYDYADLSTTLYQTITWGKKFNNKHNVNLLGGMSYEHFSKDVFTAQAEGFLDNSLTDINAGSKNYRATGYSNEVKLLSYFGRLTYDYKDKYLAEVNFRYDGSSRFAKGNQWGIFPSFSLGWRIDQEGFLKNARNLSQLKLRGSWGKLGNQEIGLYKYVSTVRLGKNYSFGNTVFSGAATTAGVDPSISWETTTMTNIGLDFGFFNNKLSGSVEIFKKKTTGILRPVNLAAQVGSLSGPVMNIGTVENKGAELGLSYQNSIRDFNYGVSANATIIKNEVVNLKGQDIINWEYITREGFPIDSYYLLEADGLFQNQAEIDNHAKQSVNTKPGDIRFKDTNLDGKITDDDRVVIGSTIPTVTYAFSLNAGYKGFELSAFFQGVGGVDAYSQHNLAMPYNNGAGVTWDWINDSWTPENTQASLPRLMAANSGHDNFKASTYWLENASYLRMKNVQLSYTFPKAMMQKLLISNLRIFVNGQNLWTISPFKKFDPEKNLKDTSLYGYPSVKMYTAGINLTF